MKSNHRRTCPIKDHNDQPIQFICLEQICSADRLICHFCIRDKHRKHWIGNIDQYIEPMARLSMNSNENSSQTYVLALQNVMTSISESWENISGLVGKQAKHIEQTIINQLDVASRTFSDDFVKKVCNDLNEGIATKEEIQNYIRMIKMLGVKHFSNPERLLQIAQFVKLSLEQVFQQTFKKMSVIMNDLQLKINKYTLRNSHLQDHFYENTQILHSEKPYAASMQTKSSSVPQKLVDQEPKILSQEIQKYLSLEPVLKIEQQYMEGLQQVNIGWGIADGIQEMTAKMRSKINKVTVTCCSNPERQLNKILSLPNLQFLQIYWHQLGIKPFLIKMINNLPCLKSLVLNCANQFDYQCSKLVTRKLSKIKKVEYGWDFLNSLRKYDQNIYFCLSAFTNRGCPLKTSDTRQMAVGLKKLQNVWLGDLMYFRPSMKQIQFKNMKQFTLGQSNGKYFRIPEKFCSEICDMRNLLSLSLLHVNFNQNKLCQILQNNLFLKIFVVQDCINVTDQTLKTLAKYCNLNSLSIRQNNLIEGIPIVQMVNLTTLILVECTRVNLQRAIAAIKNMRYLTYLNLYGNSWVTNQLTIHIPNQNNFETLNLGRTCITDQAITCILQMKQLKVICLDCAKISATSIFHVSQYFPKLQKISLWGIGSQCLQKRYLQILAKKLTNLQHLSIRYCKITCASVLLTFQCLKFIDMDRNCLPSDVKASLEKKGLKVILNTEKEDPIIKL